MARPGRAARLPETSLPEIEGPAFRTRAPTRYDLGVQEAPFSDRSSDPSSDSSSDRSVSVGPVVQVNGEARGVPQGCSLEQLLALLELGNRRVAVAVNRNVVARSHYATTKLSDGDRVEILGAVGGG